MSLRKEGKARWVYECQLCQHKSTARPDQLRAEEAKLRHEETGQHIGNILNEAFKPVGEAFSAVFDAFANMINGVMDSVMPAMEQLSYALAPPPNVPHDPTQRGDKRKWGGK